MTPPKLEKLIASLDWKTLVFVADALNAAQKAQLTLPDIRERCLKSALEKLGHAFPDD